MTTRPSKQLDTFPNSNPERDYEISFEAPEFTCLCPMTGQPDFATIRIRYIPDELCVELKSLKLYLWSFRDEGTFHEAVTNRIANDLISALDPRFLEVEGDFYIRGGIKTKVTVQHSKEGSQVAGRRSQGHPRHAIASASAQRPATRDRRPKRPHRV